MDLKSLLEPDGRPLKIVPYAVAYAAVGGSGQFVVAIKFKDYAWGLDVLGFSLISALAIIAAGHGVWRVFGKSFTTPAASRLRSSWAASLPSCSTSTSCTRCSD